MTRRSRTSAAGLMMIAGGLAAAVSVASADPKTGIVQCNGKPKKGTQGIVVCNGKPQSQAHGIVVCNGKPQIQPQTRGIIVCNGKPQGALMQRRKRSNSVTQATQGAQHN